MRNHLGSLRLIKRRQLSQRKKTRPHSYVAYKIKIEIKIYSIICIIFYFARFSAGLSVIQTVCYRLLLYSPTYENAFINILIEIRLFIVHLNINIKILDFNAEIKY